MVENESLQACDLIVEVGGDVAAVIAEEGQ